MSRRKWAHGKPHNLVSVFKIIPLDNQLTTKPKCGCGGSNGSSCLNISSTSERKQVAGLKRHRLPQAQKYLRDARKTTKYPRTDADALLVITGGELKPVL